MSRFIENIRRELCKRICYRDAINTVTSMEAREILNIDRESVLVDVRSVLEHNENGIPGSISIPLYELHSKAEYVLKDKMAPIIVYCKNGGRSAKAVTILEEMGYMNVFNLEGGMEEW